MESNTHTHTRVSSRRAAFTDLPPLTSRLKSLVAEIEIVLHVFDVLDGLVHQLDEKTFGEVLLSSGKVLSHLVCVSGTCTLPRMIPTLLSMFFCLSKATEFCKDFSRGPCREKRNKDEGELFPNIHSGHG